MEICEISNSGVKDEYFEGFIDWRFAVKLPRVFILYFRKVLGRVLKYLLFHISPSLVLY